MLGERKGPLDVARLGQGLGSGVGASHFGFFPAKAETLYVRGNVSQWPNDPTSVFRGSFSYLSPTPFSASATGPRAKRSRAHIDSWQG